MTTIHNKMSVEHLTGSGLLGSRQGRSERHFRSNIVLYLDCKNGVYIAKNRYGPHGKVSTKELIDILCHILCEHIFNGRMQLFQEGMKWRLKGAINRIIKKG